MPTPDPVSIPPHIKKCYEEINAWADAKNMTEWELRGVRHKVVPVHLLEGRFEEVSPKVRDYLTTFVSCRASAEEFCSLANPADRNDSDKLKAFALRKYQTQPHFNAMVKSIVNHTIEVVLKGDIE